MKPIILFAALVLTGCEYEAPDYAGPPADLEAIELTGGFNPANYGPHDPALRPSVATCNNVACGVADCQCGPDACRCVELGQCLPAPVQQVGFPAARDILDTSRPPQACRRNADGSWSCGPQASRSSAGRSSGVCAPQRTGPVRTIVRRLFSGS